MPILDNLVVLDSDDAWTRLRSMSYGRLAVCAADQPDVFPVNFLADATSILIRTAAGTKVSAIQDNPRVAFEVDGVTEDSAWSVVVKGNARMLESEGEMAAAMGSAFWAWAPGTKGLFLRIEATEVTGQLFHRGS